MLEVRYNKEAKKVTGWWGSRFGNHEVKLKNRPDEVIAELDIPIPEKSLDAYLFNEANLSLVVKPDYVEPEPTTDLTSNLAALEARVKKLEKK